MAKLPTRFPLRKAEYDATPAPDGSYLQGYWYGALYIPRMEGSLVAEIRRRTLGAGWTSDKFEYFVSWERFDRPDQKVDLFRGVRLSYKAAVRALHEATAGQRALIDAMNDPRPED